MQSSSFSLHLSRAIALGYAVFLLGFVLLVGEPERMSWWITGLLFWAFGAAPQLWAVGICAGSQRFRMVWPVVQGVLALLVGYITYAAFFVTPDAQSGLVFVVFPVYEYFLIGLLAVIVRIIEQYAKKRAAQKNAAP